MLEALCPKQVVIRRVGLGVCGLPGAADFFEQLFTVLTPDRPSFPSSLPRTTYAMRVKGPVGAAPAQWVKQVAVKL